MLYSRSGVEHMRSERGDWAMGKPSDPTITFARRGAVGQRAQLAGRSPAGCFSLYPSYLPVE